MQDPGPRGALPRWTKFMLKTTWNGQKRPPSDFVEIKIHPEIPAAHYRPIPPLDITADDCLNDLEWLNIDTPEGHTVRVLAVKDGVVEPPTPLICGTRLDCDLLTSQLQEEEIPSMGSYREVTHLDLQRNLGRLRNELKAQFNNAAQSVNQVSGLLKEMKAANDRRRKEDNSPPRQKPRHRSPTPPKSSNSQNVAPPQGSQSFQYPPYPYPFGNGWNPYGQNSFPFPGNNPGGNSGSR